MTNKQDLEKIVAHQVLRLVGDITTPYIVTDQVRAVIIIDRTDPRQEQFYEKIRNYVNNHKLNGGVSST